MKVKPNLFLNMSPQTTEEGALAFARNMKLDDDGNLVSDYGYKNIVSMANYNIVGHIVGLDDKVYFFCYDNDISKIVEYDEVTEEAVELNTNWTYNGGEIDGYVNTNQSGEKILTIAEYKENGNVPLKHINLKFATVGDESFYCQAPKCPTANLILKDTYVKTIPNGVYVFFIRYKIRKDVYTNWFLCSRPIFGGTADSIVTFQGGLKYVNLHKDSAKSFVFQLEFPVDTNKANYKEFQLGFIITHDEATDARTWKHFNIDDFSTGTLSDSDNLVYFDYDDVKETNIDDLLETTYELYNVRNVTSFKNKLYISNYKETDFRPNLAKDIKSYIELSTLNIDTDKNYEKHNSITLKAPDKYLLTTYNDIRNCFTDAKKLSDSSTTSIYNLINNYLNVNTIDNLLDVNISDFYKGDTVESEKILTALFTGTVDDNPDIIYCATIANNTYNKRIFGQDFTVKVHSEGNGWNDIGLVCTVYETWGDSAYKVTNYSPKPHPWYNLNLMFGFGAFGNDNEYVPTPSRLIAKGNIIPLNKDNLDSDVASAGAKFFTADVRSTIKSFIEKDINSHSRFIIGYATIYSGTKEYVITLTDNIGKEIFKKDNYVGEDTNYETFDINDRNNSSSPAIVNRLKSELVSLIKSKIVGIDDSGNITLNLEGNYVKANNIIFTFKTCEFSLDDTDEIDSNDEGHYNVEFNFKLKSTYYNCLCTFGIRNSAITIDEANNNESYHNQHSTLMPLSTYNAYIHFVDEHNIISDGIKYPDVLTIPKVTNDLEKVILQYKVKEVPANYKSFFISLIRTGDDYIETFGHTVYNGMHIVNVLEADALLYNINDNITIVSDNNPNNPITTVGKYYPSGMAIPSIAFGNCGFIGWNDDNAVTGRLYVKITKSVSNENNNSLIKATPYIPLITTNNAFVSVNDGFYGSYFCSVKKPSFELSSSCYVSGSDIYAASRESTTVLKEFENFITVQDSQTYFIRSNFNLNYLSLFEEVNDKIYRIGASFGSSVKQVAKAISSAILSSIYELKSMYKDFANKYFKEVSDDYKIEFNNTIRVSNVLSDETFNNSVFKFIPTDYYNVPTDRGIIVNLFGIGNNIYVHTKSSFYKFDGNQTIVSNNSDIQLQESEPFDIGISQIFDSEYGYGGIDTKQAGCITFDSYFFYDKASNHIFAYGGNSQVQLIDGNIYKLLAYYKPKDCKTVHDELNCRILFEFTSSRPEHNGQGVIYKTFTLSYNYKTKTFISFHDLSLVNSFAGRHRAYSYKGSLIRLFEIETLIDTTPLVEEMRVNEIFGEASTACIIEFGSQIYKKQATPFGIAVVLLPQNSLNESVDSVKYIADVQRIDPESQVNPIYDVLVNPQVTRTNPVVNFYIITNSCVSSLVTTNVNDETRPNDLLDYEGFKYEMGSWNSNYFRNNINNNNVYEYPQTYPSRDLDADNDSLVYGRFFIFVFDFKADTPIKFEELFMNTKKY